jgi:hypothetical protein
MGSDQGVVVLAEAFQKALLLCEANTHSGKSTRTVLVNSLVSDFAVDPS